MLIDRRSRTLRVSFRLLSMLACPAGAAIPLHSQAPANGKGGTVEHITVHGRALEGNLSGESRVNHIAQRIEQKVLPFFSQHLAFEPRQTSR
jgi:hypothetical protein